MIPTRSGFVSWAAEASGSRQTTRRERNGERVTVGVLWKRVRCRPTKLGADLAPREGVLGSIDVPTVLSRAIQLIELLLLHIQNAGIATSGGRVFRFVLAQ